MIDFKPKWIAEDSFDVITENRDWNAHDCHSYLIRNIGNVNVTISRILVLAPGEWVCSDNDSPDIVNRTKLSIEFDRRSPVLNASVTPGRDPYPVNGTYDPNAPNPQDNRILIISKFLTPYNS